MARLKLSVLSLENEDEYKSIILVSQCAAYMHFSTS